jgi:hypothetical protein
MYLSIEMVNNGTFAEKQAALLQAETKFPSNEIFKREISKVRQRISTTRDAEL